MGRLESGFVWVGLDEEIKGRGKEGCAFLVSPRVWKRVDGHVWKGSRIVWVEGKIGTVKYAWICVYAPVNEASRKGRNEMKKFWEELGECLKIFENSRRIFLIGDMNAKVGGEETGCMVGKGRVDGTNENGEYLVGVCAEGGLFLANTFFQHKTIHRHIGNRGMEGV